ncbi:MAG: 4-aminobutyrate--2-oxoglutarate transaminase [Propionibacteriaceae bacterium]|jgi:4-aminobutyrate aminotransferase/(S)-3-amino-2-methylpropionate transaminase|nr:4-aminobutyrate--2-oxoglutarate transaminase [Propionibacteriaceae bacterium]
MGDQEETKTGGTLPQERRLVTEIPGPRSRAMRARADAAVAAAVGATMPVFAEAAGGGVLLDVDGNSFIDLGSGIAVTTVGNAHPAVVAAVQAQAAKFTHTAAGITPYELYVRVCETLVRLSPGRHDKRALLVSTGAEAVENAVKIARAHTRRQGVAVFEHAFHGRTNLTMAMTAKAMPYKSGFGPFAPEIYRVPGSYPYRDNLTGEQAAARTIARLHAEVGESNLAAIVVEPIQGEGGFIVPAPGFLPALQAYARQHGIVFVLDEIQAGVARTGRLFAAEHEGLEPDLMTVAKGLGGGLPLAGVVGRAEIFESVHSGGLGGTYAGNPLSCAAALAVLEAVENEGLTERAAAIGALVEGRCRRLQETDPRIGDIRGRGAMQAVELVDPATGAPDPALAASVAAYAHRNGVIVLLCGTWSNVIRFLPPLSISDALLHDAFDVLAEGFARA